MTNLPTETNRIRVAVVGGGPRGISIIERLSANSTLAGAAEVHITLFDPHEPGGGRVWAASQPQHLLMNTLCADATHFTDSSVQCEGPIVAGPTLYEWCGKLCSGDISLEVATGNEQDNIRAEAAIMEPWSHPSRKLLGLYLQWCYREDLEQLPANMQVSYRRAQVSDVCASVDGYLVCADDDDEPAYFDSVVLASGHSDLELDSRQAENQTWAEEHGLFFGRPTNPLNQDLTAISAGKNLIIRGLGMNFFDYVSLLTVGRGGQFEDDGDGGLRYLPTGREPVMVVGSRRGIPYRAKGLFGSMTPVFPPRYVSKEVVRQLSEGEDQIDFMRDMWPKIVKDAAWTYYSKLYENEPDEFTGNLETVRDALDAFNWDSPGLESELTSAVPRAEKRIDFRQLDRPLEGRTFADYQSFLRWWRADLVVDYAEAVQGYGSALKCASVTLGAGRGPIRTLARYGGFLGQSYARDIEGWFRGYAGSLASGPPARRILELIALVDAGLILPIGSEMQVERTETGFAASSALMPGTIHTAAGLLEAHLPPMNLCRSANPLFRSLIGSGMARPYMISDAVRGDFVSGALHVTRGPYLVLDDAGNPQPGFYAVGVPLESIHWGTQLGPLSNTNSQFLRDSDAVARAALKHGKAIHGNRTLSVATSSGIG